MEEKKRKGSCHVKMHEPCLQHSELSRQRTYNVLCLYMMSDAEDLCV